MENNFLKSLTPNQIKVLAPILKDSMVIKTTKRQAYDVVFKSFAPNGSLRRKCDYLFNKLYDEQISMAIGQLIKVLKLDVNKPCYYNNQDFMYHAFKYGTLSDVKMLCKLGYNGSNLIDNQTITNLFKKDQVGITDVNAKREVLSFIDSVDTSKNIDYKALKGVVSEETLKAIKYLDKISKLNNYNYNSKEWDEEIFVDAKTLKAEFKNYIGFYELALQSGLATIDEDLALLNIKKEMKKFGLTEQIANSIISQEPLKQNFTYLQKFITYEANKNNDYSSNK